VLVVPLGMVTRGVARDADVLGAMTLLLLTTDEARPLDNCEARGPATGSSVTATSSLT